MIGLFYGSLKADFYCAGFNDSDTGACCSIKEFEVAKCLKM